jgi:septum formation protein
MKIILATKSPYRQAAFKMLEIDFIAEGSEVEEKFDGRPDNPEELVAHLAKLKAESVAKNHTNNIIIGFDSVGWFRGQVLEKPASRQESFDRLKMLSGNSHEFYTGIYIINQDNDKIISKTVKTEINLREIAETEINKYLDQDPHYNTYAIGFDPLGNYSSTFPKSIKGSYNNFLRGIPLEAIVEMIREVGHVV